MPADLHHWITDLNHEERLRRCQAMNALYREGKSAVAALIEGLRHPTPEVRWRSAAVLGWIGDPAALEPLAALLGEEYDIKINAVWAMGQIADEQVIPRLLELVYEAGDSQPDIRYVAALALVRFNRLDDLQAALNSDHLPTYRVASAALATARYPV